MDHAIRAFALKEGTHTIQAPPILSYADFYTNLYQNCTNAPLCFTRQFNATATEAAQSSTYTIWPQTMFPEFVSKYENIIVTYSVAKGACP